MRRELGTRSANVGVPAFGDQRVSLANADCNEDSDIGLHSISSRLRLQRARPKADHPKNLPAIDGLS
jgi:hypothetical protein